MWSGSNGLSKSQRLAILFWIAIKGPTPSMSTGAPPPQAPTAGAGAGADVKAQDNGASVAGRKRARPEETGSAPRGPSSSRAAPAPLALPPLDISRLKQAVNPQPLRDAVCRLVHGHSGRPARAGKIPGPMPRSISRQNLSRLRGGGHWVCEKSDGDRYLLYYSAARGRCYLIGRKFELRVVPGGLLPALFHGGDALLDGEIVQEYVGPGLATCRPAYLLFDAVAFRGQRVASLPLSQRLGTLRKVVGAYRKFLHGSAGGATSACPFTVQAKTFFRQNHVDQMIRRIERRGDGSGEPQYWYTEDRSAGRRRNRNDGLVFTPERGGYMCEILKWKFLELNTIDVEIHRWEFERSLQRREDLPVYCSSTPAPRSPGARSPPAQSVLLRRIKPPPEALLSQFRGSQTLIVEIGYDMPSGQWVVHRARPDKGRANFITTCMSTLDSLVDKITDKVLISACADARGGPST